MAANHFTREELAQYILHSAEDEVIAKFNALLEEEKTEGIVAYTVEGKPLTLSQYQNELEEAEKEIENGNYLTSDELKKEIATWKK